MAAFVVYENRDCSGNTHNACMIYVIIASCFTCVKISIILLKLKLKFKIKLKKLLLHISLFNKNEFEKKKNGQRF